MTSLLGNLSLDLLEEILLWIDFETAYGLYKRYSIPPKNSVVWKEFFDRNCFLENSESTLDDYPLETERRCRWLETLWNGSPRASFMPLPREDWHLRDDTPYAHWEIDVEFCLQPCGASSNLLLWYRNKLQTLDMQQVAIQPYISFVPSVSRSQQQHTPIFSVWTNQQPPTLLLHDFHSPGVAHFHLLHLEWRQDSIVFLRALMLMDEEDIDEELLLDATVWRRNSQPYRVGGFVLKTHLTAVGTNFVYMGMRDDDNVAVYPLVQMKPACKESVSEPIAILPVGQHITCLACAFDQKGNCSLLVGMQDYWQVWDHKLQPLITCRIPTGFDLEGPKRILVAPGCYQGNNESVVVTQHDNGTLLFWKKYTLCARIRLPISTDDVAIYLDGRRLIVYGQDHIGFLLLIYQIASVYDVWDNVAKNCELSGGVYHLETPATVRFVRRIRHAAMDGLPVERLLMSCNERYIVVNTRQGNHIASRCRDGLLVFDLET